MLENVFGVTSQYFSSTEENRNVKCKKAPFLLLKVKMQQWLSWLNYEILKY